MHYGGGRIRGCCFTAKVVAGRYYGPFPGGWMVRTLLDLFRGLYGVRDCDLALTPEGVAAGRYRACVRAYMGTCTAPCIGRQSHAEYLDTIAENPSPLEGRWEEVLHRIEAGIQEAVAELAFERAHELKKRLEQLREYQQKSLVIDEAYGDAEVVSILSGERVAVVHHFAIGGGRIVASHVWQGLGLRSGRSGRRRYWRRSRVKFWRIGAAWPRLSMWMDGRRSCPCPKAPNGLIFSRLRRRHWQKLIHMCRSTAWTLLRRKTPLLGKKAPQKPLYLRGNAESPKPSSPAQPHRVY